MQAFEIKKDVFWTGAVDWDLRDFHGYQTEQGSTYNAYLIKAGKNVLIDSVKPSCASEFIDGLKRVIDLEAIDYVVCNHAEMDHAGALPEIMRLARPEKLICTAACKDTLEKHYHEQTNDWPFELVKEGAEIDIGGKTLKFYASAMIHWPESMVTYLVEDKILFSNDIFGQHYATSERFADQVDQGELFFQASKYYANIFYPISPATRKFLGRMEKNDLHPDIIAPDHGLIWRENIDAIIKKYGEWASGETEKKAVVIFDTMWESTAKMARAISDGILGDDISVKLFNLKIDKRSDIMAEVLTASAVVVGCSVLNGGVLPRMADFLSYMTGQRPTNKIGATFGSYGWKNNICSILNENLEAMKIELVDEGVSVQYVPTEEDLERCRLLGKKIRDVVNS